MLTRKEIHGAAGFMITTVLIPAAFGLVFGKLEAFLMACVVCTAIWVVTHQTVQPKVDKASAGLAIWLRSRPVVSTISIGLIGATFGFLLFIAAAWIGAYLHKKTPLVLDQKATTEYEQALAKGRESKKQENPVSNRPELEPPRPQAAPRHVEPPKKETPQPLVGPSFGNLKERCASLASEIYAFAQQRFERQNALGDKPSQDQLLKLYKANAVIFRVHYLERILKMQKELAALQFKDEQLNGMLDNFQRNLIESREPGRENFATLPAMQIEMIAERLYDISKKVPKQQ